MIKRIYQRVGIDPCGDEFVVLFDEKRRLRSPAGNDLRIPVKSLAAAIAMEWEAQDEEIDTQALRLTNLAGRSVDATKTQRVQTEAETAAYIATDHVCYRADRPADLVTLQATAWDPLLAWARARYGHIPEVTTGVVPIDCEPSVVACYDGVVSALDIHELVGLHAATAVTGSLIIGLAILEQELTADAAWCACQVDETYQISRWGEDAEDAKARANQRADLVAACRYLTLIRSSANAEQ